MSIQDFYSILTILWDQLTLIEPAELSVFAPYITCSKSQHLVQFIMTLCSNFESLRDSILHHSLLLMMLLMNY